MIRLKDGREIVVTVVDLAHNRVRLGITAPAAVEVNRREVHDRIDWTTQP